MASCNYIDLVPPGTVISTTGAQSIVAVEPRGYNFWVAVQCSVFGTSLTVALQHGVEPVASAMTAVVTLTTISSATYFNTNVITSSLAFSLLPYVRLNVSANSGSHTFAFMRLYYDLRVY